MAKPGKKLFSYLEVGDDTPVQKLSILEQFRLLIRKASNADSEQLRADDATTKYQLTLQADLLEFLQKATNKLRQGEARKVTCQVSSKFLPVLDDVLASTPIAAYYTVKVEKPDIEFDIDYFVKVTLEVKSY